MQTRRQGYPIISLQKSADEESVVRYSQGTRLKSGSQGHRALAGGRWRDKITVDFAGILFRVCAGAVQQKELRWVQYRDFLSPGKIYAYKVLPIRCQCQDPPGMK
jgi:hypothetical protein